MKPTCRFCPGASSLRWMTLFCLAALLTVLINGCGRSAGFATPQKPAVVDDDPAADQVPGEPFRFALGQNLVFDHLPPEAGLSQSVVSDVAQDELGFIWLTTQDGLNRYDGDQFKIFKNDPRQPNSLSNSFVTFIEIAADGSLWVGTNTRGLNRYDPETGVFTHYLHDPEDDTSLSENSVTALLIDREGILWIGTPNSGLNALDPAEGRFVRYQHDPNDPTSLSHNTVSTIWQAASGDIWVGTTGGGLNRLDQETGTFRRYMADPDQKGSLSSNVVSVVYEDRQGMLWAGTTDTGLNLFLPETDTFAH